MDNYFFVGGNSLNAVSVVTKLRDQGFYLGNHTELAFLCYIQLYLVSELFQWNHRPELNDFLEADNFHQIVVKMEMSSKCRELDPMSCMKGHQNVSDYTVDMLNPSVKEEVKR